MEKVSDDGSLTGISDVRMREGAIRPVSVHKDYLPDKGNATLKPDTITTYDSEVE